MRGQVHGPAISPPPSRKERTPGTQRLGDWVGPEPLWTFRRKISVFPLPRIKPQSLGSRNRSLVPTPRYSGSACFMYGICAHWPVSFNVHKSHTCTLLAGMQTQEHTFPNFWSIHVQEGRQIIVNQQRRHPLTFYWSMPDPNHVKWRGLYQSLIPLLFSTISIYTYTRTPLAPTNFISFHKKK
jgi:hypothetical protein